MKKYVTVLLAALLLAVSSAGCAPELYERLLISAIGVDRTGNRLPRDGARFRKRRRTEGRAPFPVRAIPSPKSLSQIALESGRTPLYSHNAAILFGMQCAESGIAEQLDFFIRHYDSRPTAKVFLAEDTAESVLLQTDLTAERFMQLSNGAKYSGVAADVNLLQLVNGLYGVKHHCRAARSARR